MKLLKKFVILVKTEMEVSRLDENEREFVQDEQLPDEEVQDEEVQDEEVQDEEVLQTEETPEEAPGEQPPEEANEKPAKPIKGPGAGGWIVAALVLLFALVMAVPAMWNAGLAVPAVSGLLSEAGKNYQKALNAYEFLFNTDMRTDGWELGLTSGNFPFERQYAIHGKLNGPLKITQSENMPRIAEVFFNRLPRGLRKLSAQCDAIDAIFESMNTHLMMTAEEQSRAEWLLTGLEAARTADPLAGERRLIYDSLALHFAAGDPDQKKANLARLAALQKEPGAEWWMYEDIAFDYAIADRDYAEVIALSGTRLKRNREDIQTMRYNVKAIFLDSGAEKAFAAADRFARRPAAADAMELVKADIYCAQGDFDRAIALCDGILNGVDFTAPIMTPEQAQELYVAMETVRTKAGVLLAMGGEPEEARDMLYETWGMADMHGAGPTMDFFHTLLASYILAGDTEEAAALSQQIGAVPQSITDLQEGKTTVKEILTEGWGGFDA